MILSSHAQLPTVFVMDAAHLANVKKKFQQKDPATVQLIAKLQTQADAMLSKKPMSVMDKTLTPVSGNKHDYMSQAPYFWYDSSKPNGLPYLRRDGVRNPEINKITDRKNIGDLESCTRVLALTWYFTGEEKYAEKASALMQTWFIDDATKMNPNLEYAQAIPGINNGRGIGIIETRGLVGVADAVGLLEGSKSFTESQKKLLQQWYAQYLSWLLSSKNGNDEHAAKNNHGTWYYAQVIDFALFTGDKKKAAQLVEESKKRLDIQLTKEGKQPLELERTNAMGYSTMNLRGWLDVAKLAENTGIDLWSYKTPLGAGIQNALEWLKPYALGKEKWEYQQISKYNPAEFYPILVQAGEKYKSPAYFDEAKQVKRENNDALTDLFYNK